MAEAQVRCGLRARGNSAHARFALTQGWEFGAGAADAEADTDANADTGAPQQWWPAQDALPVAAALAALGRWSVHSSEQRLDAQDWWYRLRFDAPGDPDVDAGARWVLGFDGLATLAQVWLNGVAVLDSRSMFVAQELTLDPESAACLRPHGNDLLIRCRSVDRELAPRRARPRWRAPMLENQQLRWLRTSLIGRAPGWSPMTPPIGPWRGVWLERRERLQVPELRLRTALRGSKGVLRVQAALQAEAGWQVRGATVVCARAGQRWSAPLHVNAAVPAGAWQAELTIAAVDPWWPHTHGEPALYDAWLDVELEATAAEGLPSPLRIDLGRLGFRSIERDAGDPADPADPDGFALRVNGVPVFCRGACWTPLDVLSLRATPERVAEAVNQVRDAGMNMLRLAGPLVYEDEAFFDACDAAGVLVWQDFMFASMDYPVQLDDAADPLGPPSLTATSDAPEAEQLSTWVQAEVRQQLERWQARACLAVVCGNSEVSQQAAMWGAERALWQPAFFHAQLPRWVQAWLPDTVYWPSSAHGGALPFRPDTGTTSYYGVGAYLRSPDDARLSGLRFATECLAFAQVPGDETLARLPGGPGVKPHEPAWKAAVPRDRGAGWDFDDVRDHYLEQRFGGAAAGHGGGAAGCAAGMASGISASRWRGVDLPHYLAASRHITGALMADAFAQWRSVGSTCSGALVWWLRDLRPGAGWGLLDEHSQPKPAWHGLRRALQPIALLWRDGGLNGLDLHLINEPAAPLQAQLEVLAWRADAAPLLRHTQAITLAGRGACVLPLAAMHDGFVDLNHAYRFGPPVCEGLVARLRDAQGALLAEAFHWLTPGPQRKLGIGLAATLQRDAAGLAQLTVSSRDAAWSVQLQVPGYAGDDDAFDLAPGESRRITLRPLGTPAAPATAPTTAGRPRPLLGSVTALNTQEIVSVHA